MKVLIIRFSSIGDIILTSPAVRYAKQYLNAEVHYLTKKANEDLLKHNPFIDKIYLYDNNLNELAELLKAEKYNMVFDLHNNLRSLIIKLKLKTKTRTLNKYNFNKWKMVCLKQRISVPHIVTRYLETIKKDYNRDFEDHLDFHYTPDPDLSLKFNLPADYYCFSLGAKHFTKKISVALAHSLIGGIDHKVVLIGGNDVTSEAHEIAAKFPDKVTNLCAKLSLTESAQVIDNSRLVLCSDTGMMHLAAALNKETHVIWGNTVPEFGMYAYYGKNPKKTIDYEINLKCRPCSRIGFEKCPEKHFNCMLKQDHSLICRNISNALVS